MIKKGMQYICANRFLFICISSILAIVIIFYIFLVSNKQKKPEELEDIFSDVVPAKKEDEEVKNIKVDIKGAVVMPGVYEIPTGSRVEEALVKSGGLREDADTQYINLSKVLGDEMVIIIYSKSEIESMVEGNTTIKYIDKTCICPEKKNDACLGSNKTTNQKNNETKEEENDTSIININTASLAVLQKLAGIGEAKAKAIIEYRTTKPFGVVEDLKNVKGIGDAIFDKIKERITV